MTDLKLSRVALMSDERKRVAAHERIFQRPAPVRVARIAMTNFALRDLRQSRFLASLARPEVCFLAHSLSVEKIPLVAEHPAKR